jgi:REP element-mobilizing transposase RayT
MNCYLGFFLALSSITPKLINRVRIMGVRSRIVTSTLSPYSPRHGPTPSRRREPIVEDHDDRLSFLSVLAEVVERFNWRCHAYCLMTKHYHLVVETPDGNLSKGIRQLNGLYTQASNRRHRRTAHILQGRFKAILVDKDSYLLELNPLCRPQPQARRHGQAPGKVPLEQQPGDGRVGPGSAVARNRRVAGPIRQPAR